MTQTTIEFLKEAEHIFRRIDECKSPSDILAAIDMAEPPALWVVELPSQKGGTYKTILLDVMEAAVKRIFGQESGISRIGEPTIIQDKTGKFSVSVNVVYGLQGAYSRLHGIASVTSPNIQGLELATPKASSMAVKNAIKQLGGLFGKYLNRAEDTEVIEAPQENLEDRMELLPETLKKVETLEDLKSYRKLVYSKSISHEVQSIYEEKFRELKAKQ